MVEFGFTAKILLNLPIKPSGPKRVSSLHTGPQLADGAGAKQDEQHREGESQARVRKSHLASPSCESVNNQILGGGGGGAKKGPQRRIFSVT